MAKIYRRPRQLHPIAELNITNLVDLGFTLLIIFMITAPLIQSEQTIPVNLPGESKSPQKPPDVDYQNISIDAAGRIYLANKPVTFPELSKALAEFAARPNQPVIHLRGDMALQYQQVIRVISELKKRNLTKLSLDTETK